MLLIVAVGSNYALFFDRQAHSQEAADEALTLASLVIANASTVIGFGLLSFSQVPVLVALGTTVAPGAFLALLFAAIWRPAPARQRAMRSILRAAARGGMAPDANGLAAGRLPCRTGLSAAGFARGRAPRRGIPWILGFVDLEMQHVGDRGALAQLRSRNSAAGARRRRQRFGWGESRWADCLRWIMPARMPANSTDCACSRPISATAC